MADILITETEAETIALSSEGAEVIITEASDSEIIVTETVQGVPGPRGEQGPVGASVWVLKEW